MEIKMECIQDFQEAFEYILGNMWEVNGKPVSTYTPQQLAEVSRNFFTMYPESMTTTFPGVWKSGKLVWDVQITLNRSGCVSWKRIQVKYRFL